MKTIVITGTKRAMGVIERTEIKIAQKNVPLQYKS